MAQVEWEIEGPSYGNCNCDWGCPCQFNKLPTHGDCQAMASMIIEKGHYGDVDLSGLFWVNTVKWPGAVHEGDGAFQSFIDERANEEQRAALDEIVHGRAEEQGTSFLSIFASTMTTVHDPIYSPIELEIDVKARKAHFISPGFIDSPGPPTALSPLTPLPLRLPATVLRPPSDGPPHAWHTAGSPGTCPPEPPQLRAMRFPPLGSSAETVSQRPRPIFCGPPSGQTPQPSDKRVVEPLESSSDGGTVTSRPGRIAL